MCYCACVCFLNPGFRSITFVLTCIIPCRDIHRMELSSQTYGTPDGKLKEGFASAENIMYGSEPKKTVMCVSSHEIYIVGAAALKLLQL